MRKILVIGAGLSSSYLIKYLRDHSSEQNWQMRIADNNIELAKEKCANHPNCTPLAFDINNKSHREKEISESDIIVSLLPPALHILAAKDCIKFKKHMVTASYISPEMEALNAQAEKADILLLNEIGLDPGIDHLSAMQMIHRIQKKGGTISSFRSYCGGLVAKEFDNNPWHYKFTWNPKNVVTAGQNAAIYKLNNKVCYIPASRIFTETETIEKEFEAYLNRDSLHYIKPYGIEEASTVLRGTLRMKGFSRAWNVLVQLGMTDDKYITNTENITWKEYTSSFLPKGCKSLSQFLKEYIQYSKGNKKVIEQLNYLGLESETKINISSDTPANILLSVLRDKWKLDKSDLDRIVMIHYIDYTIKGKKYTEKAILEVKGESQQLTAMAKTVGLPMAIAVKLILDQQIKSRGVKMPLDTEFYEPILKELAKFGIKFKHI